MAKRLSSPPTSRSYAPRRKLSQRAHLALDLPVRGIRRNHQAIMAGSGRWSRVTSSRAAVGAAGAAGRSGNVIGETGNGTAATPLSGVLAGEVGPPRTDMPFSTRGGTAGRTISATLSAGRREMRTEHRSPFATTECSYVQEGLRRGSERHLARACLTHACTRPRQAP